VLRVVDGDEKHTMPEVATLMKHAKDNIKLSLVLTARKPYSRKS
jgi:hypothetical protein